MLGLDAVFTVAEVGAAATVAGVVLVPLFVVISGGLSLVVVAGVERLGARRSWGLALVCGAVMGLLAALPFFFLGGLAGSGALLWAGLYALQAPSPEG